MREKYLKGTKSSNPTEKSPMSAYQSAAFKYLWHDYYQGLVNYAFIPTNVIRERNEIQRGTRDTRKRR